MPAPQAANTPAVRFKNTKAPAGGYSTNPQQYAQQIQARFGMSPTELAQFMGLVTRGGQQYGAGANVLSTGSDPAQFLGSRAGEDNAADIFRAFTGKDLGEQELGYQFAGIDQWRRNLTNQPLPGYDTNVSMQGFSDLPSLTRLMGQLGSAASTGTTSDFNKILEQRQNLVPDWVQEVKDYLVNEQGLPYFPAELLQSPEINMTDPNNPLFGAGESPISLFQLTGHQAGERGFYRGLDAEELLKEIAPLYWAQYHREAGSEAPFQAGLTFGSPVLQQDGTYEYSPVMGARGGPQSITPEAMKAAGFTPEDLANAPYGEPQYELLRQLGGNLYNRGLGHGFPGINDGSTQPPAPGTMPEPPSVPEAIQQLDEWWAQQYGTVDRKDPAYLKERAKVMEQARKLNEQFYWWQNPIYGPEGVLDPDVASRYDKLRADPILQYV